MTSRCASWTPRLGVPLSEGQVGEIWVGLPQQGRWLLGSNPETSRATFKPVWPGTRRGRGYLRTGDLGFVHEGELYVCGRVKDLLIIAGRNIHPKTSKTACATVIARSGPAGSPHLLSRTTPAEALAVLLEVPLDTPAPVFQVWSTRCAPRS